jgi:hypothetical protein
MTKRKMKSAISDESLAPLGKARHGLLAAKKECPNSLLAGLSFFPLPARMSARGM